MEAGLTQQQIAAAARAGVDVLSSDAVSVPSSRMGELLVLRQILSAIAAGQLVIAAAPKPAEPEKPAPAAPPKPPAAQRSSRGKR